MRWVRIGAAALVAAASLGACQERAPADPLAQARTACADESAEAESRINACSALLNSGDIGATERAAALAGRGTAQLDAGDVTAALQDFRAASESDAQNMLAVKGRAAILVESGQLDAAEPLVARLIDAHAYPGEAYTLLGRILLERSRLDEAINAFTRAANEDEHFADAFAYRGMAKQRQRDYPAALIDYNQALDIEPRQVLALAGRCWTRVLMEADDLAQARTDASAATQADPRNVSAQLCKGVLHLRDGEWAQAQVAYEAALEVEPGNPAALFGRGVARRRGGDSEGTEDMNRARGFDRHIARTFEDLGVRTY
jgi:tetratricopeptide (TPR) repeat protein